MGIYNGPEGDDPYPSSWYVAREQEEEEAKKKAEFLKNNPDWKPAWEPYKTRYSVLKLWATNLQAQEKQVPEWATEEMKRLEEAYPRRVVTYPGIEDDWLHHLPERPREIELSGARVPLTRMIDMCGCKSWNVSEVNEMAELIKRYLGEVDITGEFENLGDEPWNT